MQNTKTLFYLWTDSKFVISFFLNAFSLEIFKINQLFFLPFFSDLVIPANEADEDPSHTRNSSTTSQASVGYSSQNSGTGNSQPGHSRQSSSGGESSHGR